MYERSIARDQITLSLNDQRREEILGKICDIALCDDLRFTEVEDGKFHISAIERISDLPPHNPNLVSVMLDINGQECLGVGLDDIKRGVNKSVFFNGNRVEKYFQRYCGIELPVENRAIWLSSGLELSVNPDSVQYQRLFEKYYTDYFLGIKLNALPAAAAYFRNVDRKNDYLSEANASYKPNLSYKLLLKLLERVLTPLETNEAEGTGHE